MKNFFAGALSTLSTLAAMGLALASITAWAQTVPVENFFKWPEVLEARLSPSGTRLAVSTALGGLRVGIVVFDLDKLGQITQAARFSDTDIGRFDWVNDERLVFDLVDLASGSGNREYAPGLFSVRFDGAELRELVMRQKPLVVAASPTRFRPLEWNHWLLHVPTQGGDEVVIGELRQCVKIKYPS